MPNEGDREEKFTVMSEKKELKLNGHLLGILFVSFVLSAFTVFVVNYSTGEARIFTDHKGDYIRGSDRVMYVAYITPFGSTIVRENNLTYGDIAFAGSKKRSSFEFKCAWSSTWNDYKAILVIWAIYSVIGYILVTFRFKIE